MLKRIIGQDTQDVSPSIHHWLNVDALAQVEVTSEDAAALGLPVVGRVEEGAGVEPDLPVGWDALLGR